MKIAFASVSTGKRVQSLYADPKLSIYPANNRLKLNGKTLALMGVKAEDRINILVAEGILGFYKCETGSCKIDKHGSFSSSEIVFPLELKENSEFKTYELVKAGEVELPKDLDIDDDTVIMVFMLSDVAVEETGEVNEDEATDNVDDAEGED